MAVYKRGAGYQADFIVSGQRYRAHFTNEAEAQRWEFETRLSLKEGKPTPAAPAGSVGGSDKGTMAQVLRSACTLHWDRLKGSNRTALNAKIFVDWCGATAPPSEALSQDNVDKFRLYLMEERRVSNSTINKYMSALSVLFDHSGLKDRPKLAWFKPTQGRVRFFSEEEVALVIQTMTIWGKETLRDLFIFLVDTGARPYSEATKLRWGNIRGNIITFDDTKNSHTRSIPMTKRAKEALERQRKRGLGGPWVDVKEDEMIALWNRIRSHITALEDTVVYTARHTCCSWQIIRGIDLRRVQIWMGHKSIQTTLNYAHLAPNHLLDNLTALEGGASPKLVVVNNAEVRGETLWG